jgi:hypothetical protein
MKNDTLFVTPKCDINGLDARFFAIPSSKINHACNSEYCLDFSNKDYVVSLQNELQMSVQDTLKHPYVSVWMAPDKNQILRFYKYQDNKLSLVGELEDGTLDIVTIHKKRFRGVEFENGKWLNLRSAQFNPLTDQNYLVQPLARLSVLSKPSDGLLFLDNIEMGKSPAKLNKVPIGPKTVKVETKILGQTYSGSKDIHLFPGDTPEIYISLKKETPQLIIKTNPTDAEIYWGTKPDFTELSSFRSPFRTDEMLSGLHRVSIFKEGYIDSSFVFELDPFEPTLLNIDLAKAPINVMNPDRIRI